MRLWSFLAGLSLGLALGFLARGNGWAAAVYVAGAVFCWRAPRCFPPEDGIVSFRAARRALRGER